MDRDNSPGTGVSEGERGQRKPPPLQEKEDKGIYFRSIAWRGGLSPGRPTGRRRENEAHPRTEVVGERPY